MDVHSLLQPLAATAIKNAVVPTG